MNRLCCFVSYFVLVVNLFFFFLLFFNPSVWSYDHLFWKKKEKNLIRLNDFHYGSIHHRFVNRISLPCWKFFIAQCSVKGFPSIWTSLAIQWNRRLLRKEASTTKRFNSCNVVKIDNNKCFIIKIYIRKPWLKSKISSHFGRPLFQIKLEATDWGQDSATISARLQMKIMNAWTSFPVYILRILKFEFIFRIESRLLDAYSGFRKISPIQGSEKRRKVLEETDIGLNIKRRRNYTQTHAEEMRMVSEKRIIYCRRKFELCALWEKQEMNDKEN